MKWYSSLSKLLLEETSQNDERFIELRGLLADRILDLYKVLLKYIITSICAYYRNPLLQYLRNLVKFDDWSGSLDDVIKAESSVKAAAGDFSVRQANSYLGLLVNIHISKAQDEIMQKLCVTDMTAEIESLQKRKDHLLTDSYKWILDNQEYKDFTDWHHGNTKRLLWIKGDAGKGKTMLLIGIVTELSAELETHFDKSHLSYFFCQGTNDRLNTATAILRGLIWMLVHQQKSLIRHLDEFKVLGSTLFEDHASFYNLKKVLQSMLRDKALQRAFLVIDALDECKQEEPGVTELLELISESVEENDKVKWLVTSRNENYIERILDPSKVRSRLSLELETHAVTGAVNAYIRHKVEDLDKTKSYGDKLRNDVETYLRTHSDNTFLWVALVYKELARTSRWNTLPVLKSIPSGLQPIYDRMMDQMYASTGPADLELCKQILASITLAYEPIYLEELVQIAGLPEEASSDEVAIKGMVELCGSFLVNRDGLVYFVHQSAKNYFDIPRVRPKIGLGGPTEGHDTIVSRCLEAMKNKLRRDVYMLQHPGFTVADVIRPKPDPLSSIRYACVYWIDHLCEIKSGYDRVGLCDNGTIDIFLKENFLRWLEALSLLKRMSEGVLLMAKLTGLLTVSYYLNKVEYLRILIYPESLIRVPTSPFGSGCSSICFV
jgi:hypothetical protein